METICLAVWCSQFVQASANSSPDTENTLRELFVLKNGQYVQKIAHPSHYKLIRYVHFSPLSDHENYCREQLLLIYPFRKEEELLLNQSTYAEALELVKSTVHQNRAPFEPFRQSTESAFEEALKADETACTEQTQQRYCPNTSQYDDEDIQTGSTEYTHTSPEPNKKFRIIVPGSVDNDEYYQLVRNLTPLQQIFFYELLFIERQRLKDPSIPPPYFYLTGGAGTGKSYVLKCVFQALYRLFEDRDNDPEHPTVAIGAYVCLAARNVGGSTIHSLLGLKFGTTPETVPLITDSTLHTYIKQLDQLKVLLFDEISYIGGRFLP